MTIAGPQVLAAEPPQPQGPTLEEIKAWPATVGVREACRALGYSTSWGYQLVAEGAFPCRVIKTGGRVRVLTRSLISLLETGEP